MATFEGKAISTWWKNLMQFSNSSNTGVSTSVKNVEDGRGHSSAIYLSDDALEVRPENDNTTSTFATKNQSGNNILAVNTTDSKVLVGATQTAANTQYAYFGCDDEVLAATSANTG